MTAGPGDGERSPDVLDTGPRPGRRFRPGGAAGRRFGPGTAGGRRWSRVVVAAAGAAVVVLALRVPAGEGDPPRRAPVTEPPVVAVPPFNGLPGRTQVAVPTVRPGLAGGTLPGAGRPDREAALGAAQLVLGRYCAEPAAYTLTLGPDPDWRRVSVLVFALGRSGDPPRILLRLTWTGAAYRWTGRPAQLRAC